MTVSTGVITSIAGSSTSGSYSGDNGPATSASLYSPQGVALDSIGILFLLFFILYRSFRPPFLGNVYIADAGNNRIRKVTVSTGIITTIAGTGASSSSGDSGPATSATLNQPKGVSLDSSGNFFSYLLLHIVLLTHLFILGNVYIAERVSNRIRKVTISTGIITTIAGNGGTGSYSGDSGAATAAALYDPSGIVTDLAGK